MSFWGAYIQLCTKFTFAPNPIPSPARGRSSRCNTQVLRTNADGERHQTILKT